MGREVELAVHFYCPSGSRRFNRANELCRKNIT